MKKHPLTRELPRIYINIFFIEFAGHFKDVRLDFYSQLPKKTDKRFVRGLRGGGGRRIDGSKMAASRLQLVQW